MSNNKPIGVFDSGLGGLTVFKELKKVLPNENFIYFGDTGRVPYGNRSKETILKYALEDETFLLTKDVKLIIAACGTVSSLTDKSGKNLPVPFFEMITPAAIAAAKATRTKKIGVIGTVATVNSNAHKKELLKIGKFDVLAASCPLFVPLVENGLTNKDDIVVKEIVSRYLKDLKDFGCDTLILGCTHYPALYDAIDDYFEYSVKLINPGEELSIVVKKYLEQNSMLNSEKTDGITEFYVSDHPDAFCDQAKAILGEDITGGALLIDIN